MTLNSSVSFHYDTVFLQVDLKCVSPAEGGQYYLDHLPILGTSKTSSHTCITVIYLMLYFFNFFYVEPNQCNA